MTRGFCTCRLKAVLAKHGLTQTRLVQESGVSHSQVSGICAGRIQPCVVTIIDILDALHVLTGKRYGIREVWAPVRALQVVRKAA